MTDGGATRAVARFITQVTYGSIPEPVREAARRTIADTIAVLLAGSGGEVVPPLREYLKRNPSPGSAPVIGWGTSATPEVAAMVNGTLGHALDYDEVTTLYPAHPSVPILAALLASPEPAALDGEALVTAYCTGFEVGGQIARGIGLAHYHRGWHATGTLALFSALAAVAKARGLTEDEICTAIGVAASFSSGMQRNFGTMTKPLHSGWAARSALVAAELSSVGWTASPEILDKPRGYLALYGDEASDPARIEPALGVPWVFAEPGVSLKKYPCCWALHRAIDAVLQLRAELGAGNIARLSSHMPPGAFSQVPYMRPVTGLEGKFSPTYAPAAALLDGEVTLATFTDQAVSRPQVAALYDRIEVAEDPACNESDKAKGGVGDAPGEIGYVEVTATTTSGETRVARVYAPTGSPQHPMTWAEIEAKFADCARSVLMDEAQAAALFAAFRAVDQQRDVRSLVAGISLPLDAIGRRA
ncbi:MAG TPA: MmgE/PrpD family protein [Trebonia sp.]|jgi:2-methylcitrate dehydratase PrpD|nr:MmgE/PrpD family protein [Trebonia sp.]